MTWRSPYPVRLRPAERFRPAETMRAALWGHARSEKDNRLELVELLRRLRRGRKT